jgi:serine/threonine-protein kinase
MSGTGVPSPHRFGRYVLIDRLGKGGMAEVFRAIMPGVEGFRRDLVIKQIRPDQSRTRNFIEMFVNEARISAQLHHPNIVQVFDFGQVDGCYFLAMELLRGRDLLAVMKALRERRRPFPIPIAIHVAQQVAVGLGYAHALKTPDGRPLDILHRDVSPSNIMCLATGGVKLLDFGIASAISEGDSDAEESTFKGKLSYLAPERLGLGGNGNEPKLDGRIDLFSLGTVLWEVLAGRRLFQGKTDADKLRAVLERPIPPPSSLRGDIPPRLDEIVLKALERDRDRRYLTGQALADDLEELAIDTKYQSRMLPMLLQDLFGVGGSRSHMAISALPPELLIPPPAHPPTPTPTPTLAALSPDPGARTRGPAESAEQSAAAPISDRIGATGDSRLDPLRDTVGGMRAGAPGSTEEAVPAPVATNLSAAEMSGSPTPLPPAPGRVLATVAPSQETTHAGDAGAAAPVARRAIDLVRLPSSARRASAWRASAWRACAWREVLRRLPVTSRQGALGAAVGLLVLAMVLTGIGVVGARSGARARSPLVAETGGHRPVPARAPGGKTGTGTPMTIAALPLRASPAAGSLAAPAPTSASPPPPSGPFSSTSAPDSAGGAAAVAVATSGPERLATRDPAALASKIVPKGASPASPKAGSVAQHLAPPTHPALARPAPRPGGKTLAAFALAPRPGPPRPSAAPPGRAAGTRTGADGRVEKGLSIDPFAEQAARLTARPRP